MRGDFGGTRHRGECDIDAELGEVASGQIRKRGCDPGARADLLRPFDAAVFRYGHGQPAAPKSEIEHLDHIAPALGNQIGSRHPKVGGAVGDELRNVRGAHKDGLKVRPHLCHERTLGAKLGLEAGGLEEFEGLLMQATLVGKSNSQHDIVL